MFGNVIVPHLLESKYTSRATKIQLMEMYPQYQARRDKYVTAGTHAKHGSHNAFKYQVEGYPDLVYTPNSEGKYIVHYDSAPNYSAYPRHNRAERFATNFNYGDKSVTFHNHGMYEVEAKFEEAPVYEDDNKDQH